MVFCWSKLCSNNLSNNTFNYKFFKVCEPDYDMIGLLNGFVVCSDSTNPGSECTFTCSPNYQIVGGSVLTCLEISSTLAAWSIPPPICRGNVEF